MIELTNLRKERELESKLRNLINELIKGKVTSGLRGVYTENNINKKTYGEVLKKYFDIEPPKFLAIPDIILVFEESGNDFRIVAIELKYFRFTKKERERNKKFREAFREIGQPLRYYIFGYDAVVLWHVFHNEFDDNEILPYSKLVEEVIEKLKLPIGYFPTKILSDNMFRVYNLQTPANYSFESLLRWIKNVSERLQNPISDDQIYKRRKALKTALKIP